LQFIRAGVAGLEGPSAVLETRKSLVLGRKQHHSTSIACHNKLASTAFPIKYGIIRDWDAMSALWDNIFYEEMLLEPSSSKVCHHSAAR
jgi:actin-related protein